MVRVEKNFKSDLLERSQDADVSETNFRIFTPRSGDTDGWAPSAGSGRKIVERYLPFLTRLGPNTWRDDSTGDVLSIHEVLENYGQAIPDNMKASLYDAVPAELAEVINQIDCRLIETQRLLILNNEDEQRYYRHQKMPRSALAIAEKAKRLKKIMSERISEYATLSQSLDRTFPKRVIERSKMNSPEDLKAQLQSLDVKRGELMSAGIIQQNEEDEFSLSELKFKPAVKRVLTVYAEDTEKKLNSLTDLLAKIKLFKDLIDERFITKDVKIIRESGIDVFSKELKVPLDRLSSGEQHQLVLFFELLFETKNNSLFLIDEPELSLHIAWQKNFIPDLLKIIDLNKFDVILATHSPIMVARWTNFVVRLGDAEESNSSDDEDEE